MDALTPNYPPPTDGTFLKCLRARHTAAKMATGHKHVLALLGKANDARNSRLDATHFLFQLRDLLGQLRPDVGYRCRSLCWRVCTCWRTRWSHSVSKEWRSGRNLLFNLFFVGLTLETYGGVLHGHEFLCAADIHGTHLFLRIENVVDEFNNCFVRSSDCAISLVKEVEGERRRITEICGLIHQRDVCWAFLVAHACVVLWWGLDCRGEVWLEINDFKKSIINNNFCSTNFLLYNCNTTINIRQ